MEGSCLEVLDVGCGSGRLAAALCGISSVKSVDGISNSDLELDRAARYLRQCYKYDLESSEMPPLKGEYDFIVFSHVVEHTRWPHDVLSNFASFLKPAGRMIVIVPNALHWRCRVDFLRGRFEYAQAGVFDSTHLRFFTYRSFTGAVVPDSLQVQEIFADGHVPLGIFRRLFPRSVADAMDDAAVSQWPGIFGTQIGLVLRHAGRVPSPLFQKNS
jgi:SAM-dependent methyltransferase